MISLGLVLGDAVIRASAVAAPRPGELREQLCICSVAARLDVGSPAGQATGRPTSCCFRVRQRVSSVSQVETSMMKLVQAGEKRMQPFLGVPAPSQRLAKAKTTIEVYQDNTTAEAGRSRLRDS